MKQACYNESRRTIHSKPEHNGLHFHDNSCLLIKLFFKNVRNSGDPDRNRTGDLPDETLSSYLGYRW